MTLTDQQPRPAIILLQVNGLIFLSFALTFLGPVFALIPLVVLFGRHFEVKWVVPSIVIWLIGLFFLNKPLFLYFLMFNMILSLAVYYFYNLRSDWNGLIVSLTIYAAVQVCVMVIYQRTVRKDILDPILKTVAQLPIDDLRKDQVTHMITRYTAALLYIFIMTVSFVTVFVSGFFTSVPGGRLRLIRQMETIKLNFHFIWVMIAAWAAVGVSLFVKNDFFTVVATNAAAIVSFFYFMQGLVVSSVFISNLRIAVLIKILVVGLIVIFLNQTVLLFILCSIGVFDEWVGFRNIKFEQPNGGNEE